MLLESAVKKSQLSIIAAQVYIEIASFRFQCYYLSLEGFIKLMFLITGHISLI